MNTRVKILKALNGAYPFKLERDTLLAGVRLDGRPVAEGHRACCRRRAEGPPAL